MSFLEGLKFMDFSELTNNPDYKRAVKDYKFAERERWQAEQRSHSAWKRVNKMEEAFKKRKHFMDEFNRLLQSEK